MGLSASELTSANAQEIYKDDQASIFDFNQEIFEQVLTNINSEDIRKDLEQCSWVSKMDSSSLELEFVDKSCHDYHLKNHDLIEQAFCKHFNLPVKLSFVPFSNNETEPSTDNDIKELENDFGLTRDQAIAFNEIREFFRAKKDFLYRVKGYAGTGKSYLICQFIRYLSRYRVNFLAACPTNKAAKNLRNIAREANLNFEIKTVSQLLGQQPELNKNTGKEEFIANGTDYFEEYSLIIIDEFSMVSKPDFENIVQLSNCYLTKVLFVGDGAQLPPVKEKEPMVMNYPMGESELCTVIRYDGEIARVAEAIRSDRHIPKLITTEDGTINRLPLTEWLSQAIDMFDSDYFAANPDYVRFLAWRNSTVKRLNSAVRSRLWGENVNPYVPGDRLIALKPLFTNSGGGRGKNKWKIHVNNSEEMIVNSEGVLCEIQLDKEAYQYWSVSVRSDHKEEQFKIMALHDDSLLTYKKKLNEYVKKKQWSTYFDLVKGFDQIGYAYALTVHKAQGSTINNVFLDIIDMQHSPDRRKLLYTALTRTKDKAFIY